VADPQPAASPNASGTVVVATQNAGKLREVRSLLAALPAELIALTPAWAQALPEEGDGYEANALAKARAVARCSGCLAVADDAGLEVEALGGRPGPHSARFGGPGLDDAGRVARLLEALAAIPEARRGARFVCFAAAVHPDGRRAVTRGVCEGKILPRPSGGGGFGYDPVFQASGVGVSMAELSEEEKHRLSHRGSAFRELLPKLREWLAAGGARRP